MSLRIQNNIEAFNAHRQLVGTTRSWRSRWSGSRRGYRINRAADDAAGLAISEKLRAPDRRPRPGPAQRAGRRLAGADRGGLATEVHAMLQRVRELAVQYNNGTLSATDKAAIQSEVDQLGAEIERIGPTTEFNGIELLDRRQRITFQVGADDGQTITVSAISLRHRRRHGRLRDLRPRRDATSPRSTPPSTTSSSRARPSARCRTASSTRSTTSATYQENLTASESRIRDVDMAAEMVNFTKLQILQQAGTRCSPRPTRPRRASSASCGNKDPVTHGTTSHGPPPKAARRA